MIIPALNEQQALPGVLAGIRAAADARVLVVDNGSTDATAAVAEAAGAQVVREPRRGYGSACLAGIAASGATDDDVVVFMDADGSDDPFEIALLVEPILDGTADLVIGSRELGEREAGALKPHARFGNQLAVRLIKQRTGQVFTDLGPFRAIRMRQLRRLQMSDRGYGWTVEMQLRAAGLGLRCIEVPVRYRRRIGRSKISGTIAGSLGAAAKIIWTIARHGR